jgi:hypothetical protein
MGPSTVERFGYGILGEKEDLAAVDPGQAAGARDQQEAQRPHAAEGEGVGRFRERGLAVARVSGWKLRRRLWARTLRRSQALFAP